MRKGLRLAAAAVVLALGFWSWPRPPAAPAADPALAACHAAQAAVKERLKTVATALFPDCRETNVRRSGPDQWQVEGRFDADFLFGENARTGYAATVRRQGNGVAVIDLKIWP